MVSAIEPVDSDGENRLQVSALETIDAAAAELGEPLCSEEEQCTLSYLVRESGSLRS